MDFLTHYGLFFAETATLVIAILLVVFGITALLGKDKSEFKPRITIKKLNDDYEEMAETLNKTILSKKKWRSLIKEEKKSKKTLGKAESNKARRRIFVLDFKGDVRASAVNTLRHEVTAILTVATPEDEVIVKIESPGGVVHGYGLAASQLQRIRDSHISLTACVDKVAASGGYLMACVADRILAAPFAIIGSIGVVGQLPNFHRWLKKKDVDYELLTAGEYKRTLTVFGENTKEGRLKFQEELEETHVLFKNHITEFRPKVNIEQLATGESWLAKRAYELQLVDQIITSDDCLMNLSKNADLYEISCTRKKSVAEKLFSCGAKICDKWLSRYWEDEKTDWLV